MSDEPMRVREKCYPPVWSILTSDSLGLTTITESSCLLVVKGLRSNFLAWEKLVATLSFRDNCLTTAKTLDPKGIVAGSRRQLRRRKYKTVGPIQMM